MTDFTLYPNRNFGKGDPGGEGGFVSLGGHTRAARRLHDGTVWIRVLDTPDEWVRALSSSTRDTFSRVSAR